MNNTSTFWNGFFKGLAAPVMAFEPAQPEFPEPRPLTLDDIRAELDEIIPRKSVLDDMAAVYGDFLRALERTR